jgi:hypothetical protein
MTPFVRGTILKARVSCRWLSLAILLIATALRLYGTTYGYDEACLAIPDEYWLHESTQVSSAYTWDIDPDTTATSFRESIVADPLRLVILRILGALSGVITVALTVRLAQELRTSWGWLAGLLVAAAPWLVSTDRWIVRFDLATLVVAVSSLMLLWSYRRPNPPRWIVWLQLGSALSLLLIAPPLWWLAAALIALQPQTKWREVLFVGLLQFALFPALQSPLHWLNAVFTWDMGATAACVWGLMALAMWRWRSLEAVGLGIVSLLIVLSIFTTVWNIYHLPRPIAREWELVHWLQERLPDDVIVQFDPATWHLNPVVACLVQAKLRVTPIGNRISMVLPPQSYRPLTPDYIVTVDEQIANEAPFVYSLDSGFYVGRALQLPMPVDVNFGDLFYLLSYQLVTPTVPPGGLVDVRLDLQFSPDVNADILNYGVFVHITLPGRPGDKVVNYNVSLVASPEDFAPRRLRLNQHHYVVLPTTLPSGKYDVIVGFFKPATGEILGTPMMIGQIATS